jgi:hypothetical protein
MRYLPPASIGGTGLFTTIKKCAPARLQERAAKHKRLGVLALNLVTCCVAMQVSSIAARDFTLSIVARTGDAIAGHTIQYLGSPAINNRGLIVFTARFSDIPAPECPGVPATALCTSAIVAGRSLLVMTGSAIAGHTLTWISDPVALNEAGTVAFAAGTRALDKRAGQHAIFTQNQLIAKPVDIVDGCEISQIGYSESVLLDPRPFIDNVGHVFFSANPVRPCRGGAIVSNVFTQRHAVSFDGKSAGYFGVSGTGLAGALTDSGIYSQRGLILRYRARIEGHVVDGFGPPAINDAGRIAFAGQFDCSPSGCLNAVAREHHLIAKAGDMGGVTVTEFWTPVINNRDVVAFRGLVGPDNVNFLLFSTELGVIAKPGDDDIITSKTLQTVGRPVIAGYMGLNDDGCVVFEATFTDGSQAIVLATPVKRFHAALK